MYYPTTPLTAPLQLPVSGRCSRRKGVKNKTPPNESSHMHGYVANLSSSSETEPSLKPCGAKPHHTVIAVGVPRNAVGA